MSIINLIIVVLGVIYVTQKTVFAQRRIVGGTFCQLSDHPYVVQVYSGGRCGGSLISYDWVLTAAHCINIPFTRDGHTKVRSGFNSTDIQDIQERTAKYAIVHERFNREAQNMREPPELRYDIALVLVNTSFKESATLKILLLPKRGRTSDCKWGVVCGSGEENVKFESKKLKLNHTGVQNKTQVDKMKFESKKPKVNHTDVQNKTQMVKRGIVDLPLKCVDLEIISGAICTKTYPGSIVDEEMLVCTRELVWGKDACQGDSGGPLLCHDSSVILGIISFGYGCGLPGKAAVHTRVAYYLDFINKVRNRNYTDFKWSETDIPSEEKNKENKVDSTKIRTIQGFLIGSSVILLILAS